ncbi:glutamyl-tRNA reductase [Formosimonas limnophila]|uniref:Glutamyl-tRNA reductase n=1 Tax=Formosimonas limnophila TaxID=1384487 RepID=A0A8J3CIP1_9BURK|nr:glutamyl-tRNA reductase [Formosimonas limnophila]
MPLFVIGLNHTTAPLALRERVAFAPSELSHALPTLCDALESGAQVAVLSTCNRAEVYAVVESAEQSTQAAARALAWLADYHHVPTADLAQHIYVLHGQAAIEHAFAVASGMDSMVLGEPQILGQMKQAIRIASHAGTNGTALQQWFDKSFTVAKEVRTQTAIGEHSVSMAAASVKLARHVFDDFTSLRVLLVGAGEMIEVVAAHVAGQNPANLSVANRSLERAEELLAPYQHLTTTALRLAELPEQLSDFDLIITSTASTLPIIGLGMVEFALKQRRYRPMVMVDLGVPRDIEAAVAKLNDAYLYTIDDLSNIVKHNSAQREAALTDAQKIITSHVAQFDIERTRRNHSSDVQLLRQHFDRLRQQELDRAINAFTGQTNISHEELRTAMSQMSQRLINKILHEPTIGIQSTDDATRQAWQTAMREWLNNDS